MSVEVAETLNDMKTVLMEHGWEQGTFAKEGGGYCLMGSFTRSVIRKRHGMGTLVISALHQALGDIHPSVIGFNDTPGRTFNEVIDLIDAAILKEKESAL